MVYGTAVTITAVVMVNYVNAYMQSGTVTAHGGTSSDK